MASRTAKQLLRKEMKKKLRALTESQKTKESEAVLAKLFVTDLWQRSQRVSVFLSMPDEIQTEGLLSQAFAASKALFIPRYIGPHMDMVRLHSMDDYRSLPLTSWNIRQPADDEEREEALSTGGLDLILVPGLAFTVSGKRLGRGKGYYDTYLARCEAVSGHRPRTVALAYNTQICDDVPTDQHDYLVDQVLYDDRK